ncbi:MULTISPECIES: deoxyguanosinetriphosphate triphosphohydrolase [Arthrobacter]|uniref:Deoxyguanosinetriphosphate triphosphohydrolase-like protein n=1 Tax=Arthrobacter jinronghuae TaxID=2964609 RepID=A0ABT1NV66_9MICC|nr:MULTISPECIES: deoxyguanosinetriphosphate triphosphohydrolase [Arthrobacter]MCQ1951568.1 deoxyguanosinetriphosphate triphosphohydrolase [Arthrobacter jinronghuae]MCQ1954748.1 deoxyguanosinetriphosphate triphosphohydrolase [Arthrobacter sp. zg-Y238]MCQ1957951.1 deoxyguanosinetriphosphate triphosphohydrolase [Arthrobacter jinronghuae]UWX79643.1 deoxyguanosinetriphosphate triphosphohydrolase [Arthrobacter jinronghuae]
MTFPQAVETAGYTEVDLARWVSEPAKNTNRTQFGRDRARVLHSSALRRLGAKTQVVAPDTDDFVRTRLTHSLEVAQVGRELGNALGCDPDVVDAACLSHDLGHPPFGHNGETALNDIAHAIGGFEGNAQTLRLLTRLEPKIIAPDGTPAGLNLTRASLDAATKYPWSIADAPLVNGHRTTKFGVYEDDLPVFTWLRDGAPDGRSCLEAQVMDLADDISYSVHDVEDAIVAGHVQLKWLDNPDQRARVVGYTQQWYLPGVEAAAIDAALARLEATNVWVRESDGSRRAMAALKDMTSQLIGRFCNSALEATRGIYGTDPLTRYNAEMVVPEDTQLEIAVMKGLATTFVMTTDQRQPLYERQREILTALVAQLSATGDKHLDPMFAADWRDAADDGARLRVVVDQVASLTDGSALALHERLVGPVPALW